MIIHLKGDLLAEAHQPAAILHGVNVQGVMGAGFALALRKAMPDAGAVYFVACRDHALQPGGIVAWRATEGSPRPSVIHCATQEFYGSRGRARIEWLQASLQAARIWMDTNGITSVAMPRIGTGLGGLSWEDAVLPALDGIFGAWPGEARVYTLA